MEDLVGMIVGSLSFVTLILLVKIISDNKIRHKLIDKGMVDEKVKYLYPTRIDYSIPSALKWGMVLIGLGLAFLIGRLVPTEYTGEVTVGGMFFFGGLGLVIYYFIAKKMMDQGNNN
jgi:hypothetical protein